MDEKRLEFRGGRAMALVPFVLFIVVTISLSFANFQDINAMVTAGVIALLIGMIFCKSLGDYWEVVLKGLGSKVAMTAVMLWLVVGMYGAILKSGHIVEGLVWLSVKLGLSGAVFTYLCSYVAGDAEKGLESLANVTPADNETAKKLIEEKKISVELSGITSRIFIQATVETDSDKAVVTIRDSHTNITRIEVNGEVVFDSGAEQAEESAADAGEAAPVVHTIHKYSLSEILDYVNTVPVEEIAFVSVAYRVNLELFEEGLNNPRTTFARTLLAMNGGEVISKDEKNTGSLLCNAAIEARVIGLDKPAMSITGSGAHGIIATMPIYGVYKIGGYTEEQLYRATMLSYLICTYIKEYSGRLSAFCGCAIAAGSGMACGICYLKGGGLREMEYVLNNMASSITGMICDGGNQGCTMKGVAACDTAFRSVEFAMKGVHIDKAHGINGATAEDTMRNMGLIASPGMVQTEKTIVEIFENKLRQQFCNGNAI